MKMKNVRNTLGADKLLSATAWGSFLIQASIHLSGMLIYKTRLQLWSAVQYLMGMMKVTDGSE